MRGRRASRASPSTSTLSAIGSSSEPSGDVRPCRRASLPSKKSVVIATQKTRGRPVRVVVEVPGVEDDDDRDREGARDGQLVGRGHRVGRIRRQSCSTRFWSPTAVRSRSASSARCASSGSASVAVYSEADRGALHVSYADEAYLIGPAAGGRELPQRSSGCSRPRCAPGAGAVHPGLRLPRRERGVRAGRRGGGARLDRAAARGDRADGLEDARARTAMQAAGVPIIPGTTDPVGSVDELLALGEELGYPLLIKAAAGGGGKGMEEVHAPDAGRARVRDGAAAGPVVLREPRRLRREADRRSAPRRGAGARRRARQRHPSRRARLHDPAPPPEARRGDAVAGGRRRAARAHRRRSASTPRALPATARPGRSRGCSRRTASTSSWR